MNKWVELVFIDIINFDYILTRVIIIRVKLGSRLPDGSSLVKGPINLDSWATRRRALDGAGGVGIPENSGGGEDRSGKARRNDNVKVLSRLIRCDKNGIRLADVNIKGREFRLEGVGSFNFHHLQSVALNSEVERALKPHV